MVERTGGRSRQAGPEHDGISLSFDDEKLKDKM
jgi:hypothetical protein